MKERWERLLSHRRFNGREFDKDTPFDPSRNPFVTDCDRIVFSGPFRRLGKKTQVHPLSRNDHIHNRLTHSMEVACVARSIAVRIGYAVKARGHLPDTMTPEAFGDIVQAACLAHDIGNPPFGHAGESAIQDWFTDPDNGAHIADIPPVCRADFEAFDGNAQGFRVVTALENNKDKGGLRLTCATLGALVKYPNAAYDAVGRGVKKFNFYQSEKDTFEAIFRHMGLADTGRIIRHPLSYITEAADDICYRIIDMEDARELRIISYDTIRAAVAPLDALTGLNEDKQKAETSERRRVSFIRTKVIGTLIDAVIAAFDTHYDTILTTGLNAPLIDQCDAPIRAYMHNAKTIFNDTIRRERQKVALEIGSYGTYKILLDVFVPACCRKANSKPLTYKDQSALTLMGNHAPTPGDDVYTACLRVIDFVTGMTDTYAAFLSEQFSGTGSGR